MHQPQKPNTMGKGRPPAVTGEEIAKHLETASKPLWAAQGLADEFDVAVQTIRRRLDELLERGRIEEFEFPSLKAYYVPGRELGKELDTETSHRKDLVDHFSEKFAGIETAPWTALHPNDGMAVAGDKLQLEVVGKPGDWSVLKRREWEDRREALEEGDKADFETQALVSAELYASPTTPIEHVSYSPDIELEEKIGARWIKNEDGTPGTLVASGPRNYLIDPCDDAVFFGEVSVDDISPKGEGYDADVREGDEEVDLGETIEKVQQWREENIDDDSESGL